MDDRDLSLSVNWSFHKLDVFELNEMIYLKNCVSLKSLSVKRFNYKKLRKNSTHLFTRINCSIITC